MRHGTLCLLGSWDVVAGQMIAPTVRATRTEEDFLWHIHHTIATDPEAGWVFVLDNLNTHGSESLVRYVAELEGLAPESLGKKNRHGILRSVARRREFLSDPAHRVRFVYLPKHTSWLNQIEVVFGIVKRRRGCVGGTSRRWRRCGLACCRFWITSIGPSRVRFSGRIPRRPQRKKADQRPRTWKEKWASRREARETLALVA